MPTVIRSIERPPEAHIAAVAKYTPATVHEAQGRRGALDARLKPVAPGMRFCGPAVTASCHIGDNLMIFEAIALAEPGDVLILAAGDNPQQGGFGEVLATACQSKGLAAFVTDAGVRDGTALRAMGFPVFSLGLCIKGTTKETIGTINHPIVIGGEWVRPGDLVVGDDDGIVIVRREEALDVAAASEAREAQEALAMASFRRGVAMDISHRQAVMRARGATWSE